MNTKSLSKVLFATLWAVAGCSEEAAPVVGSPAHTSRSWSAGDSFVYQITSTRTVSAGQFSASFDGELAITVVGDAEDGGYALRGDVREAHCTQSSAEDLSREVQKPFFFTAAPSGKFGSFLFSEGVAPSAAAAQRELVLTLQLTLDDAEAARGDWQATERDSTGEYVARYSRKDNDVHKEKVKYLTPRGADDPSPMPGFQSFTVRSSVDFALDESLWPRTVGEKESYEARAGELVLTSTKTSSARLVRVEQQPGLVGSIASSTLVSDAAIDAAALARAKVQADQDLVDGQTFQAILADLRSADTMTRNQAQGRLAALIRLGEENAVLARSEVGKGQNDLNTRKRLIGALGAAGTPQAQRALVAILEDESLGASAAIDALVALALTRAPTVESADAVARAMESAHEGISSTATLTSGSQIRSMVASRSGDTRAAMSRLLARVSRATKESETVLLLEALGNTGDARAVSAILPFVAHESTAVRASAVRAMRFMTGAPADGAVMAGLVDPELEVQKAAAGTLQHRPSILPVLVAVKAVLDSSKEQTVRNVLLSGLRAKDQELRWIVDRSDSAGARIAARDLLKATQK